MEDNEIMLLGGKDGIYFLDGNEVKPLVKIEGGCGCFAYLNGQLYHTDMLKKDEPWYQGNIFDAFFIPDGVFQTSNNKLIAERYTTIHDLCVCNGQLFDCIGYGPFGGEDEDSIGAVFRTEDSLIINMEDSRIGNLASIDNELYYVMRERTVNKVCLKDRTLNQKIFHGTLNPGDEKEYAQLAGKPETILDSVDSGRLIKYLIGFNGKLYDISFECELKKYIPDDTGYTFIEEKTVLLVFSKRWKTNL